MPMTINGSGSITGLVAGGLPNATITQAELAPNVAGNGPVGAAYLGASQSIPNDGSNYSKILFNTADPDIPLNSWDTVNSQFKPNVAGYYTINAKVEVTAAVSTGSWGMAVYKNGVIFKRGDSSGPTSWTISATGVLTYLNGTTDFIDIRMYQATGAAKSINAGSDFSWVSCFLTRAA